MLHPSYQELINTINEVNKEKGKAELDSRYGLVVALSKRAKELNEGADATIEEGSIPNMDRKLSVAVGEARQGNLSIYTNPDDNKISDKVSGDSVSVLDPNYTKIVEDAMTSEETYE